MHPSGVNYGKAIAIKASVIWHAPCIGPITNKGEGNQMQTAAGVLFLALTACGTAPALEESAPASAADAPVETEKRSAEAHPVAEGAAKGAGKGALACAVPTWAGAHFGPIGFAIGGIITLYCLPFGIVGGAIIGGISAAAPVN